LIANGFRRITVGIVGEAVGRLERADVVAARIPGEDFYKRRSPCFVDSFVPMGGCSFLP